MEYTYFADNNKNIDFDHLNKLTYHADIAILVDIAHCMQWANIKIRILRIFSIYAIMGLDKGLNRRYSHSSISIIYSDPHMEGGVISKLFQRDLRVVV